MRRFWYRGAMFVEYAVVLAFVLVIAGYYMVNNWNDLMGPILGKDQEALNNKPTESVKVVANANPIVAAGSGDGQLPEVPVTPETPSTPDTPATPETPVTPETPKQEETPSNSVGTVNTAADSVINKYLNANANSVGDAVLLQSDYQLKKGVTYTLTLDSKYSLSSDLAVGFKIDGQAVTDKQINNSKPSWITYINSSSHNVVVFKVNVDKCALSLVYATGKKDNLSTLNGTSQYITITSNEKTN